MHTKYLTTENEFSVNKLDKSDGRVRVRTENMLTCLVRSKYSGLSMNIRLALAGQQFISKYGRGLALIFDLVKSV